MPKVDIVIPSWNGKGLLAECLTSLKRQTLSDFRAIVVDDASTDGTEQHVHEAFPWATVARLEKNGGFCKAVNAGIALADAPYILLLNNDVTLHEECLERLVALADQTGAALVAPLILWRDEQQTIYSAGDCQRASGRPESMGFCRPLDGFLLDGEVFGITAAAGLYKREVFERVGVFDVRFGTYFSDSDLSFRARLAGYRAALARDAVAWHVGSASLGGNTLKRTRECCINHVLLVVKNIPRTILVLNAPAIVRECAHQARRLFSAARCEGGAFFALRELARAQMRLLSLLPHALRERRRIQRARRVPASEISKGLTR